MCRDFGRPSPIETEVRADCALRLRAKRVRAVFRFLCLRRQQTEVFRRDFCLKHSLAKSNSSPMRLLNRVLPDKAAFLS